jgi:hypothetical protein
MRTNRAPHRWAVCAACLAALATGPAWGLPAVLSRQGPALSLVPAPDTVPDLRLVALNVHAYVEKRKEPLKLLLQNVTTMPMPDAAAVAASGPPALRRLFATRLLAYARDDPPAREAVKTLIGESNFKNVLARLDAPESHTADAGPRLDPEATVTTALASVMGANPLKECSDWTGVPYVDWKGGNIVSMAVLADGKGQTIKGARKGLDPQSWDDCAPELWKAAYLVKMNGDQPEIGPDGDPVKAPEKVLGSEYDGWLFEHFVCGPGEPCSLKVLLEVFTRQPITGPEYWVRFQNPKDLGGTTAVLTDFGFIEAWSKGGDVSAHVEKVVGFPDVATAGTVYTFLQSIDFSFHLAELICCLKQ